MAGSRGMRGVKVIVLFLLMPSFAAWADDHSSAHKAGPTVATQASLNQSRQKLERQQAQVKHLQDTVAKQQSDSKKASDRMKQQDKAIVQMQQQLKALHAKSATGHR